MQVINIQNALRRWWLELSRLAPRYDAFKELAGRPRTEIAITGHGFVLQRRSSTSRPLAGQSLAQAEVGPAGVCRLLRKGEEVVVSVDAERCFARQVKIPRTAVGKIGSILELDMARVTPFAPGRVFAGWINHGPSGGGPDMIVEHVIIKKDVVAGLLDAIRERGARPIGLFVRDAEGQALPMALAIDGTPFGASAINRWTRIAAFSFATLVVGLVTFATVVLTRQSAMLEALAAATAGAEKDAAEVRDNLERIKSNSAEISTLRSRKTAALARLEIIEELSRILPDTAFLNGVSIESGGLVADGGASSPEQLIATLEASPYFRDVSFASPVFRNPGEERSHFSIRLGLEPRAEGDKK